MRQVYLSPRASAARASRGILCPARRSRAHTYTRRADAAEHHGREQRRTRSYAGGRAAGLRLPDAQTHLAPTEGEGWSGEERRAELGGGSAGKHHQNRSEGGGVGAEGSEVDETNLPQAPSSRNWIPTCGGWGDRAGTAGEVPAFGRYRGGSCLLPVLR